MQQQCRSAGPDPRPTGCVPDPVAEAPRAVPAAGADVDADAASPPPAIRQARYQTDCTLMSRVPDQTGSEQAGSDQARPGRCPRVRRDQRPVSANFSARPGRRSIRGACRAGAVDAIGPPGPIVSRASSPARYPLVVRVVVRPSRTEDRRYEAGAGHARGRDAVHRLSSFRPDCKPAVRRAGLQARPQHAGPGPPDVGTSQRR